MKKSIYIGISCLLIYISLTISVFAQTNNCSNTDKNIEIECLKKKLAELGQQKNTLSSQIQEMDTQMYIKSLTIQSTEQKITETQHEIETLTSRIDGLDTSLNTLSKLLIQRIVKGYKRKSFSIFDWFLNTNTMGDLVNTIKYQKTTQDNNQKLLIQVQEAKTNYEEQKILRETKKKELDDLISALENQKVQLKQQQEQKRKLLVDTNNDETTYQSLLAQAQAQLRGFSSFVQSSGGDTVIEANAFGAGSDGIYYSQRDARWAYQRIGYSSESILKVGCLLTSISMVAKKYGHNITPADFAADPSHFWANTAWMNYPWPSVAGKSMTATSNIDEELNNGNYVIVGIAYSSCAGKSGGDHYVVLKKKDGNDYIMHDPIYGPDLKFSSHYSIMCSSAAYK